MRNIFSDHTALTLKWCFNPTWVFKWFGCPPSSTKDMLFKLYEVCMDVLLLCTWTQHYRHKKLEQLNYSPSASSHRTFVSTSWVKSCIFPPNCYGNYTIWILGSHYAGTHTECWVSILRMSSQRATVSECLSAGYCSTVCCQSVSSRSEAAFLPHFLPDSGCWKYFWWTVVVTDKLISLWDFWFLTMYKFCLQEQGEGCCDNKKLQDDAVSRIVNLILLKHSTCAPITMTLGFFKHQFYIYILKKNFDLIYCIQRITLCVYKFYGF